MTGPRRRFFGTLVLTALVGGPGCMGLYPKRIPIDPACEAQCCDLPCACRGKVYIFLMSGLDPLDLDHVRDCRETLIRAGFTKVYNGQCYHDSYFAKEMHRIALAEPDAKFVVVGFSLGADEAVSLAESVGHYNIPVTLLASVDPYRLSTAPTKQPANVQQVMRVHGEPLVLGNRSTPGLDVAILETFPSSVTDHPLTMEALMHSLIEIAGSVPKPAAPPTRQLAQDGPTPRPVSRADRPRDGWDFLKPVADLRKPSSVDAAPVALAPGERTALRPAQP
jgi:hypothetical protein